MINHSMRVIIIYPLMLTMMSCALFNADEAKVRFRFTNSALVKQDMIRLTFTDGRRIWKLDGEDFAPDAEDPHSFGETSMFETATSGKLKVSFELRAQEEIVSAGGFEIPLRPDWH